MEIQLRGRLVTCTPEEYKRLIDLNLIEVPAYQTSDTDTLGICDHWVEEDS